MKDKVTIPKAEYDRLCALEEELSDIQAALAVEARIVRGEEDLIPASVVDRLIDGEPPLRVWREFRNLTQAALGRASDVNRVLIVEIEAGRAAAVPFIPCASWRMRSGSQWTTSSRHHRGAAGDMPADHVRPPSRSSPDRPTYRTASPRPSCAKRGGSHRELANHESTGSRITASRGCTPPPRVRHGPPRVPEDPRVPGESARPLPKCHFSHPDDDHSPIRTTTIDPLSSRLAAPGEERA